MKSLIYSLLLLFTSSKVVFNLEHILITFYNLQIIINLVIHHETQASCFMLTNRYDPQGLQGSKREVSGGGGEVCVGLCRPFQVLIVKIVKWVQDFIPQAISLVRYSPPKIEINLLLLKRDPYRSNGQRGLKLQTDTQ